LSVGAPADVAVLRLVKGSFGFSDVNGARMAGTKKLEGELTTINGKVMWDLNGITRSDWKTLGHYGAQGDPRWDGIVRPENRAAR
jgi:dihydroorotase